MIPSMLCKHPKEAPPWHELWWISEQKLDGIRLQLESTGELNRLWSRLGNDRSDEKGYEWLRNWLLPAGTVLDGELAIAGGSSNQETDDVDRLMFYVFDVMSVGEQDVSEKTLLERKDLLRNVMMLNPPERVVNVEWRTEGYEDHFREVLAAGGEGIILKRIESVYQPGKRSWDWLKVKRRMVVDMLVIDCEGQPTRYTVAPGKVGCDGKLYENGKLSSSAEAGYVNLRYGYMGKDGKPVIVGQLGFTGPRAELEKYVGKVTSIDCWGGYDSACLRHPAMIAVNDEKVPDEITYENVMKQLGNAVIRTKNGRRD